MHPVTLAERRALLRKTLPYLLLFFAPPAFPVRSARLMGAGCTVIRGQRALLPVPSGPDRAYYWLAEG